MNRIEENHIEWNEGGNTVNGTDGGVGYYKRNEKRTYC